MVKNKHIFTILFLFISFVSFSQKNIKGYRIDGDEIVFQFDKRDYEKITDEKRQKRLDFADFEIDNVVVSGEFNMWSRDKWSMKKVNENIYELRKKIADFEDNFDWEFKFIVNNNFWAEPSKDFANITPAINKYGSPLFTYNLKIMSAYPSENGNTTFSLEGFEDAKEVIVCGSFNKWDEELFPMNKTKNGWKLRLELKPEIHQYKFIVDGKWIEDPANENKVTNEFGGNNSVVIVKTEVTFLLSDFKNAKEVILAGSFNDWSEDECVMKKTKNGWEQTLELTGGKYHYKYIVDGEWFVDPNNSVKEYDEFGNINSVKMVR